MCPHLASRQELEKFVIKKDGSIVPKHLAKSIQKSKISKLRKESLRTIFSDEDEFAQEGEPANRDELANKGNSATQDNRTEESDSADEQHHRGTGSR